MSLQAITEKRQSPAGCSAIFFQLFDWNRRLAKKKLFSTHKFITRARQAERAAKKLGSCSVVGGSKLPIANKLLLIAHENRGGFPGEAPIGDDGMRAAGLVARLMGLESMPVVNQNKPKEGLDSEKMIVRHENSQENSGNVRTCSRATKTEGFIERSSKSMLSRDKRQDPHKLPSPVKSPRSPSRTSTTRLLQSAATKILEPQVHSRSLARCTITYIDSDNVDGSGAGSSLKNGREAPIGESLVGLQSRESGSDCSNAATAASSNSNGSSVEGKIKTPVTASKRVRNAKHIINQAKHNVHSMEKKPGKDVKSRFALRNEPSKQHESPLVRDKEAHATRPSSRKPNEKARNEQNGAKDFIRLNKNLRECSPTRSLTKVSNNFGVEVTRSDWGRNIAHKKRPSQGRPAEIVGAINATFSKQAAVGSDSSSINHRKEAGLISGSATNRHGTGRLLTKKADSDSGIKDNGIVSFTFSSPMKHMSTSLGRQEAKVKGGGSGELTRGDSCSRLNSDRNVERMTLRGNQLSNLLEQKIKQLTCLDGENLKTANPLPAKSTATILVELISALTTEDPFHLENKNNFFGVSTLSEDSFLDGDDLSVSTEQDRMLILKEKFQEENKTGISASFSMIDSDQPSPVSILEATFSNDSCSVGSPCSSGGKQHFQSIESFGKRYMLDFEANLVASVTPTYTNELDIEEIPRADDKKPGMHGSCLQKAGFSEAKINSISEVISNAQLLFESTPLFESDATMRCSVDILLLSILETNLESFQRSPDFGKEEYQLRDLLFDCIIEWFDSKCSLSCCSGYRAWLKLHAFLSRGRLLREVNEEIRGWGAYAGRVADDLIEKEIRVSTPMWTQFEIEAFEIGMEIENEILIAVVDEMVADMLLLRVYSSNPTRVYGLIDSSIL